MNAYREDRTSAEIDRLLNHDFIVPINRGYHAKFVEENYPGWTWNQLIRVLTAAGVRVPRPGSPSRCHDDVVRVQFDSEVSWRVEWKDGTVTEGPEPAGTTVPTPSGIETGVHDLSTGLVVDLPDTPEQIIDGPQRVAPQSEGWPADEHPIFIDSGFGHVAPSAPVIDGLGERRRLTAGVTVRADAGESEFAATWADVLAEKPSDADRWEYSVEDPQPEEGPSASGALPLEAALERVRLTPGARLRRRPVGRWRIAPTPFPRLEKSGWGEVEVDKRAWHAAMCEFAPSYRSNISRMGGVDGAPDEWTEFARRAAAAGFTPSTYRMLGTAHLAWKAREAGRTQADQREIPALASIEVWAPFPGMLEEGLSLLEAIGRIVR